MPVSIRRATTADTRVIRDLYLRAFTEAERDSVATLAEALLSEELRSQTRNLAAEVDGEVVGHVAFSEVAPTTDAGWRGEILAPLAVAPAYQGRGVGAQLVEAGLGQLAGAGVNVVFVYGDPAYYGRFGFDAATATRYRPPYALEYPLGWQAKRLDAGPSDESPRPFTCVAPLMRPELW